eukprot:2061754-Prymnesium_polylepis.2
MPVHARAASHIEQPMDAVLRDECWDDLHVDRKHYGRDDEKDEANGASIPVVFFFEKEDQHEEPVAARE